MHKSYESAFLGLYRGIFKDIAVNLPTVTGLERDSFRVSRLVATRGLRSLTVDFPAFGKHFDACLDAGRFLPSRIPGFGMTKRVTSHQFLGGLLLRVFSSDGVLKTDYCPDSVFFIRQVVYAAKKPKFDCKDAAKHAAFERYQTIEASLRPPTLNWVTGRFDGSTRNDLRIDDRRGITRQAELFPELGIPGSLADAVHFVADVVSSSLGSFEPKDWRYKHGPGAVAGKLPVRNWKYSFPTWSARLESVFPQADLAVANYGLWDDREPDSFQDIEVPSMILPVHKSQKTPRLIAKEPVSTMWCQQAVWDYLEHRTARTPISGVIHFRDQSYNSRAALEASKSGSHWTVDLSDASDRLSLWLVERLFRANTTLLDALRASRSVYCSVPTRGGRELLKLKKFAPQGSASTFPLQTLAFAILAVASVIESRRLPLTVKSIRKVAKEVLVFGDDTVVPVDSGRQYVELLTYCGLSVNLSKTYHLGKFRESCGTEAFDGWDVTPAYLTVPIDNEPTSEEIIATVECCNNFFKKGLWHAAAALEGAIPRWVRKDLPVVGISSGAFGLRSYAMQPDANQYRWNRDLQRDEYRVRIPIGTLRREHVGGIGHLLQYFTEAPNPEIQWSSGVGGRAELRLAIRWVDLSYWN